MAETFTVTGITKTVYAAPGELAGPGMEVAFITRPSEIRGSVTIPQAMFTTDEVGRQVAAAAAVLEQVKAL